MDTIPLNQENIVRNKILKKSLSLNVIYKIFGVGISYLTLPFLLKILGTELYGVWITIFTTITWLNFFDLGISHGLKNKLTISIVNKNIDDAKSYIFNTFLISCLIAFIICGVSLMIISFIDLNGLFNLKSIDQYYLRNVFFISILFITINFVLKISEQLYHSIQKTQMNGLKLVVSQLFSFVVFLISSNLIKLDLLELAIIYGASQMLIECIFLMYFFYIKPELKINNFKIDFNKMKSINNFGLTFFLIQLSMLIIYNKDSFLILRYLGPNEVTNYNIVMKIFNVFIIGHTILLTPFWTIYTEAFIKKDFKWIKKSLRIFNYLTIIITIFIIIVGLFLNEILELWTRLTFHFSYEIIISCCLFIIVRIAGNIYMYFLNGINNIKLQMTLYVIGASINIPLSIFLLQKGFGLSGIFISSFLSILPLTIFLPIQVYKIIKINEKAQKNIKIS